MHLGSGPKKSEPRLCVEPQWSCMCCCHVDHACLRQQQPEAELWAWSGRAQKGIKFNYLNEI